MKKYVKGIAALALAYLGWFVVLMAILPNENDGEEIQQYRPFTPFSIPDIDTTGTVEWVEPAKERVVEIDGGVYYKIKVNE
jgi:hypothetical protein